MKIFLSIMLIFSCLQVFAENECLECHEGKVTSEEAHAGVAMECTMCHGTHADETGNEYNLYTKTINLTCAECHELDGEVFPGGHLIVGHPQKGPHDPVYPKKKFTCASCHNPHGGKGERMFRYDYSKETVYKGSLCAVCHWKIALPSKPPTPPWE